MHELTATQNILSLALDEAAKVGATRITKVSVKVGAWSTFEPDCIELYFSILARDTLAEGAQLAFEVIPVVYRCESCGLDYTPAEGGFSCPTCSSGKGSLVTGRELYVDSIEVQHADTGRPESPGGE